MVVQLRPRLGPFVPRRSASATQTQHDLSTLTGKVPSSVPFGWRELAWARAKKLESTDRKKPRLVKTGHNWQRMPTGQALQHVTHPCHGYCSLDVGKVSAQKQKQSYERGMNLSGTAYSMPTRIPLTWDVSALCITWVVPTSGLNTIPMTLLQPPGPGSLGPISPLSRIRDEIYL